jgi:hypothetical protein
MPAFSVGESESRIPTFEGFRTTGDQDMRRSFE